MKKSKLPPIQLSPDQLADIDEGLAMLDSLGPEIDRARSCGLPGMDDCEQVRADLYRKLTAYRETYGKNPARKASDKRNP